jgi:hypothetical protein
VKRIVAVLTVLALIAILSVPVLSQTAEIWQITRADYGHGNQWVDVTDRIHSLVQGNALNFTVNRSVFGIPGRGHNNTLRLQMVTRNGLARQMSYRDSHQVNLRVYDGYRANRSGNDPYNSHDSSSSYPSVDLRIVHATYGANRRTSDVTSRVNSQIQSGQINLLVNNATMGGDPAPGESKILSVEYRSNGQIGQSSAREGETLRLPYGTVSSSNLKQRFTCQSSGSYGRNRCSADTSGGVRLVRQIGGSRCNQGTTWDYDNQGVWVSDGCSAEFETGNGQSVGSYAATSIPSGTEIAVRTNQLIESNDASAGQRFGAEIASDVLDAQGRVMIPRGSNAELVIRSAYGEDDKSSSKLILDIDTITISGRRFLVSTSDLDKQRGEGIGANRKTGVMVGGGAAVGTLLGAILGGGKGAAIGAAVGAGAGLGTVALTRGKQVRVPAETVLKFRLDRDLRLQGSR